jgi:hypothetical protein
LNVKNEAKTAKTKAETLRFWLIRAIWGLGGITLAGIALGGILLSRISKLSGWSSRNGQEGQVEVYSKEQIDKFITSVLIAIQIQALGQENAQADMVFIASFKALNKGLPRWPWPVKPCGS